MRIIIDDRKFEGFHQYVFWNNKFFKSEDIDDSDLHVYWVDSISKGLDAEPLSEDFLPDSGVIASNVVQLNGLLKAIKKAKGPFSIVLYSRDGGIQSQKESIKKRYRTKQGYCISTCDGGHEMMTPIPQCVSKIFCSNVDFPSGRIICYPYGIMQDTASVIEDIWNSSAMSGRRKFCYANFNTLTNRKHRIPIWEKAKQNSDIDCAERLSLKDYVRDLCSYRYVLCPKGNGIDTMRMWESIYCGAIPIVQKSGVSSCFSSLLPIVEVDDWDINREHLESIYPSLAYRLSHFGLINKDHWKDIVNEL